MQDTKRFSSPLVKLVVFASIVIVALIVPVPRVGRELDSLGDSLHAAFFFLLSVFGFQLIRSRRPRAGFGSMLLGWLAVSAFGLTTEFFQPYFGRNASWSDAWTDVCGALAGFLWAASHVAVSRRVRHQRRILAVLALLIGLAEPIGVLTDVVIQRLDLPRLASFELPLEMTRWTCTDARVRRVREQATDGDWSLRVDLQPGVYPRICMIHPVPDWSGYDQLEIDVYLTGRVPLDMTIKIQDKQHNNDYHDRFNRTIHLVPGPNHVQVPLVDVFSAPRDRDMDPRAMAAFSLFAHSLKSPRTLYVDNLRFK